MSVGYKIMKLNMKRLYTRSLEKYDEFRKKRIEKKVRKKLISDYEYSHQVELILEQWVIKRIVDGAVSRRKELAEKQARIKEISAFLIHLKNL
jgi:hypothetical protein